MRMHIESSTGMYTDDLWPQPEEEWLFISSYQLPIINPQLEAGPQGPSAIHGWLLLLCWSYYESLVWVITAAVRWCLQQACYVQKSQLCSQHAGSYVLSAPSSAKFPEPWMRGNGYRQPVHSWVLGVISTWHCDQWWVSSLTTAYCKLWC